MNVRIVKFAVDKKVFPPMEVNMPRFIIGRTLVNRKGWKPYQSQTVKNGDDYAGIAGPERPQ